jgi:hypothetical protein
MSMNPSKQATSMQTREELFDKTQSVDLYFGSETLAILHHPTPSACMHALVAESGTNSATEVSATLSFIGSEG